jgi:hypothetical protein
MKTIPRYTPILGFRSPDESIYQTCAIMRVSDVHASVKTKSLKGATVTPSPTSLYTENNEVQTEYFKTCTVCNIRLPINRFGKSGLTLESICKKCRQSRRKEHAKEQAISCPITSKLCARCKIEKPVSDFPKCSAGHNGLHSYCKECKLADDRAYAEKITKEKVEARRLEYLDIAPEDRPKPKTCFNPNCPQAGVLQPPENFHKSKIHKTGLMSDCIVCELERKLASKDRHKGNVIPNNRGIYKDDPVSVEYHERWYQERKEELNKRAKEWRVANPDECKRFTINRRFRQYGVTEEWYNQTLAEQCGCCAMCGSKDPKNKYGTFHIDHNHLCCSKSCHACDKCRRGLLCSVCNTKLGVLESKKWAQLAKEYLRKYPLKDDSGNDQPSLFDGL